MHARHTAAGAGALEHGDLWTQEHRDGDCATGEEHDHEHEAMGCACAYACACACAWQALVIGCHPETCMRRSQHARHAQSTAGPHSMASTRMWAYALACRQAGHPCLLGRGGNSMHACWLAGWLA
eukprot:189085-Chlamydomonas_euryale.AAC.2